jgi:hypothetical protein
MGKGCARQRADTSAGIGLMLPGGMAPSWRRFVASQVMALTDNTPPRWIAAPACRGQDLAGAAHVPAMAAGNV